MGAWSSGNGQQYLTFGTGKNIIGTVRLLSAAFERISINLLFFPTNFLDLSFLDIDREVRAGIHCGS
jgi:hypothetical protein